MKGGKNKTAHDVMMGVIQRHSMRIATLPDAEHEREFHLVRKSLEESVPALKLSPEDGAQLITLMMETMRALVREIGPHKGTA